MQKTTLGLTAQNARRLVIASGLLGAISAVINGSHGAIGCAICGALAVLVAAVSLVWGRKRGSDTPCPESD